MQFDGALVTEQRITFAIVVVNPNVLNNSFKREEARNSFKKFFPLGVPLILMAQDSRGIPTYQGRDDIVRFLSGIDHRRIPWKRYAAS